MLRKIRLIAAIVFFTLITLLFLDFTGTIHGWFGWMAKIQFLPAVLALNVGVVLFLVLLTVIFGRIYCSVICPMGVFQDLVAWISKQRKSKKKLPYTYSPAISWLRYGVLALFVLAIITGIGSLVALLAPYSSYGRIASNLFQPLWMWGNNLLAYLAERADNYLVYETEVWIKGLPTFIIAIVTFIVICVLAWKNGRTYCNTICPVGTVLGLISRYSLYRITMDPEKCNQCSLCSRNCKAACIDFKNHKVDNSRCVACMNCLSKCKRNAITFKPVWGKKAAVATLRDTSKPTDASRRRVLSAALLVTTTHLLKAQNRRPGEEVIMKKDGGLEPIKERKERMRETTMVPSGALSIKNLTSHCTACQLCISVCPNHVLKPSGNLMTLMQPEMGYERGFCRPECTKCSSVCPTGAIHPITKEEKTTIQIGHAVWEKDCCIVNSDNVECGNCARHCPTGSIQMVPKDPNDPKSLKIPIVNEETCIGCGACEHLCPSRPYVAIHVVGHERHRSI